MAQSKNIRTSHQTGAVKRLRDDIAREFRTLPTATTTAATGTIRAGAGLTGGGTIPGTVSLSVQAADSTITVGSAGISVNIAALATDLPDIPLSNTNPQTITDATPASGNSPAASRSDHVHAHGARGGGTLHANVVAAGAAGFMSGSDKTKLDGFSVAGDYIRADGTVPLTGAWAVDGNDITGISYLEFGDCEGLLSTWTGDTHSWTSLTPVLTVGSASAGGAPTFRMVKDDAQISTFAFRSEAVDRWTITCNSSEDLLINRLNNAGVLQDSVTFRNSTGQATFPGGVTATGNVLTTTANAIDLGDTVNYWRAVYAGSTRLRDGIAAPGATANYATTYVDTADGFLKTVFADGAIATLAPGENCQTVVTPDRSTTDQQVVSSAAITTVFTGVVPQASMGLNGIVRVTLLGSYRNNDGAGRTLLIRLQFGGVTHWLSTSASVTNDADPRPVRIVYEICNQNSASVQAIGGEIRIGGAVAPTTGQGGSLAAPTADFATIVIEGNNGAINTGTADRNVEIAIQHSASSANLSFTRRYAFIELIPT